jgi:DNA-binding transcriptional LysR family regulator
MALRRRRGEADVRGSGGIKVTTTLPELGNVKCFIALAEELHFGRAAERLNMTQPTLSQRIRRIEADLGTPLFARSTRSVELSPSGEAFLPLAREILVKFEQAVILSKLANGSGEPGGDQLTIGAIDPAAHRLLPNVLRRFRQRFPATRLEVSILDSSALLRGLERGDFHVGIMRPPTNANLIQFHQLIANRFVAVIPTQFDISHRKGLRLADFVDQKVFTLNRFELTTFRDVYDAVVEAGITPDPSVKVTDTTAAMTLASAGFGITFLPDWVESIAGHDVVIRPVEDLLLEIPLGVAWLADSPVPGILPFVEHAKLVCATTGPR